MRKITNKCKDCECHQYYPVMPVSKLMAIIEKNNCWNVIAKLVSIPASQSDTMIII